MANSELRMYSLVLYQLSGIQAGIQAGHSNDEYANVCTREERERYLDWRKNHKTVMVMDGGSSATLEWYREALTRAGIVVVGFKEPDLYDQVTSYSFLLDDRYFGQDEDMVQSPNIKKVRNILSNLSFHGGR